MRLKTATVVAVAILAVISAAGMATAQDTTTSGFKIQGDVSAGARVFINEPGDARKGKLNEYRDLSNGPFLEGLHLRILTPNEGYVTEFGGSKWGREDQEFFLTTGRVGLWGLEFNWDQIPHVFSTTGRTLYSESMMGSSAFLSLTTPRRALSAWNNADRIDEISTRWDTARIGVFITPTPDLDIRADYSRIHKDGTKPFSLSYGSSPGVNFAEFAAPVDQTIHDFRIRATYARPTWQLQLTYAFSAFDNGFDSYTVDNPCFGLGAAAGCTSSGGAGAQESGRISAEPSNHAHTISLAGGVNLPLRTRVAVNASTSLQYQSQDFLQVTNNPAILNGNPSIVLPSGSSLNGFAQTSLVNLNVSSRPIDPLTLTARYRFFNYDDKSAPKPADSPAFAVGVLDDRCPTAGLNPCVLAATSFTEELPKPRPSYDKHNLDLDARLRILQPVAFTVGGGWERFDRDRGREVEKSDEFFAKAAVDVTPADWLSARVTYRPSFRRYDNYDPHAEETGQQPLFRKFDEAERNRQRVDLLLQLMPTDAFTTAVSAGWRDDDFIKSRLGLQKETTWTGGIDFNWTPLERVALSAGYVYEMMFQKFRARARPAADVIIEETPTTVDFDFPDWEWISDQTDRVHTFHAGATVTVIPKLIDFSLGSSYAISSGSTETRNPTTPLSHPADCAAVGVAASTCTATAANAIARRMPTFEDQLLRFDFALRYHFAKAWTATLGYVFESFQKHDFRTDQLLPFNTGSENIFLGNDSKNYTVHIIGATLAYHWR
jgi:MtrB/PioB family decaheme-associated outer membrane protein